MLDSFVFGNVLGVPLLALVGILGFVFLVLTVYFGAVKKDLRLHKIFAGLTVGIAFLHGLFWSLTLF